MCVCVLGMTLGVEGSIIICIAVSWDVVSPGPGYKQRCGSLTQVSADLRFVVVNADE